MQHAKNSENTAFLKQKRRHSQLLQSCYPPDVIICFPHYGNPKVFRITCQTGIKYPIKTLQYSITQKQTVAKCFLCFCLFLFRSYYRLLFTPFTVTRFSLRSQYPDILSLPAIQSEPELHAIIIIAYPIFLVHTLNDCLNN